MPTISMVIEGYVASREWDAATLSRLAFWGEQFGDRTLTDINPDEVDAAVVDLAQRGKLRGVRNGDTIPTGKPLAPSTINRYITQLQSLYRYAKRMRLLPRAFVPPTTGIEKAQENPDPDNYLRPEEVDRLLKVARLIDRRPHSWGRLEALILTAYHTGLRRNNVLNLRWRDVDLEERTAYIARTKNGEPMVSVLTPAVVEVLQRIPFKHPDALIFGNKNGKPFHFRRQWLECTEKAGLPGRNFHQLRHGCGHALAMSGVAQGQIMMVMGHKTLGASARYIHANVTDKRRIVDGVFANQK
jgi:integrase